MGKINGKLTPNQKKILSADLLYEKRMNRLRREGYIFPSYMTKPYHPKKITKKYIENYNENITTKNLKTYAIGKTYNIQHGKSKYVRVLNVPKNAKGTTEEKLKFAEKYLYGKIPSEFTTSKTAEDIAKIEKVEIKPNKMSSLDFNPHDHPTTSRWMTDTEQNITYRAIIKQLKSYGTFPFANWLLDVIEEKIQVENIDKGVINDVLSKMQGYGFVITREMLYDKEATGDYARALISMLPLSMEESSRLYSMVDEFISVGEEEIG